MVHRWANKLYTGTKLVIMVIAWLCLAYPAKATLPLNSTGMQPLQVAVEKIQQEVACTTLDIT